MLSSITIKPSFSQMGRPTFLCDIPSIKSRIFVPLPPNRIFHSNPFSVLDQASGPHTNAIPNDPMLIISFRLNPAHHLLSGVLPPEPKAKSVPFRGRMGPVVVCTKPPHCCTFDISQDPILGFPSHRSPEGIMYIFWIMSGYWLAAVVLSGSGVHLASAFVGKQS